MWHGRGPTSSEASAAIRFAFRTIGIPDRVNLRWLLLKEYAKCLTEVLVSPKCVASDFAVQNTGTMLGPCTWKIALILLVSVLALTSPTSSQVVHGVESGYEFNDEHVHLTNYIQEGTDIHEFLKIRGTRVGRSVLFDKARQQVRLWEAAHAF